MNVSVGRMTVDEMDAAWRRDYADQRRLDDLRHVINAFLENPPARLHKFTEMALRHAAEQLWEDNLRIVRTWD